MEGNNQITPLEQVGIQVHSKKLIDLMVNPAPKAKQDLMLLTRSLMPGGTPDYIGIEKFPPIRELLTQYEEEVIVTCFAALVRNLCASLNVKRNMNEDQQIDVTGLMLEKAGEYRMEDYLVMFSMIKRGELIDVRDRLDIQMIGQAMKAYDLELSKAFDERDRKIKEERSKVETISPEQQEAYDKRWDLFVKEWKKLTKGKDEDRRMQLSKDAQERQDRFKQAACKKEGISMEELERKLAESQKQ